MDTKNTAKSFIVLSLVLSVQPSVFDATASSKNNRIRHARELLGPDFNNSKIHRTAIKTEKLNNLSNFVHQSVYTALPKAYKKKAAAVAEIILSESSRAGFDPVFVMAVIQNESSFKPHVRGSSGEIGLMQILPKTAAWIAKKYKIAYHGEKTLKDPVQNIRIGCAFLTMLKDQFDSHSQLYLAAYNMGARNVKRNLEKNTWPKIYPQAVMKRYISYYDNLADMNDKHVQTVASNYSI